MSPRQPHGRADRRSGFTLIEMMLAISIAAVIVLTAVGLMRYVEAADGRLERRFDDMASFGRARLTLERAMSSLLAAPEPEPVPLTPAGQPADPTSDRFGSAQRRDDDDPGEHPFFALGPTDPDDTSDRAPRKIEMRLKRSPIAGAGLDAAVLHGAFELVPYSSSEPSINQRSAVSWALLWTPIEPRGDPTILVKDLEYAAWEALNDDMKWVSAHTARLVGDIPRAVHVELFAWSGARVDWLFEPLAEPREDLR